MRSLRAVYQLARADFLERTRTFQYLATIGITLWIGSLCLPPKNAHYIVFSIDGYRGFYNSTWVGIMFAMVMGAWLSLVGFYLVKSAVARDRQTRVGEIVASTSVGKFEYVLGKTLSNFLLLATIVAVFLVDAAVMQLVRGEDTHLNLLAIVLPSLVVVVPAIALVSAVAVFFEVLPVLRGGIGNVVYFFMWIFALSTSAPHPGAKGFRFDLFGMAAITDAVWKTLSSVDPLRGEHSVGLIEGNAHLQVHPFLITSLPFPPSLVVSRMALLLVALGVVALAALTFDRFSATSRAREAREPKAISGLRAAIERATTPLLDIFFSSSFGGLVLAELRLLVRGMNFWWFAVAAGLWIWTLFAPAGPMASMALGFAWIWPILVWSQMGTRETLNQTEQLVYPTLHPLRRQFAALLCAGILLALAFGSGSMIHALAAHDYRALLGILAGAIFTPSLALACGAVSGTTRVFEVIYLFLWYVGPMNGSPLDYTSAANAAVFSTAAALSIAVAFYARRIRLAAA